MSDKPDHSSEDADKLAEHRARMRHDWSNLIDDLIEEGRKQGAFDNLPGKGKPLKLENNPYGRETELAHNLLKHNDLRPAWITNRNSLLEQIEAVREEIGLSWARHDQAYRFAQSEGQRGALRISWDDACQRWQARIADLNKLIDGFNLKRPSNNLELFKLNLEQELERAQAPRWLK
jgi:DnaJ family protein C protein 28